MKRLVKLRIACYVDFYYETDNSGSDADAIDMVYACSGNYVGRRVCANVPGHDLEGTIVDRLPFELSEV
jgi:hypothetical protein